LNGILVLPVLLTETGEEGKAPVRNEFNNQMLSLRNQSGSSMPGAPAQSRGAVLYSQAPCCPGPVWASKAIGNIF